MNRLINPALSLIGIMVLLSCVKLPDSGNRPYFCVSLYSASDGEGANSHNNDLSRWLEVQREQLADEYGLKRLKAKIKEMKRFDSKEWALFCAHYKEGDKIYSLASNDSLWQRQRYIIVRGATVVLSLDECVEVW